MAVQIKGAIQTGENGALFRVRPGEDEDNATKRAYLSKDGEKPGDEETKQLLRPTGLEINDRGELWQDPTPRNQFGGMAPPGYGEHPSEDDYWETPLFSVHPLTRRKEAVSGIFYRLWPENVKILQQMKLEGWPHVEIVAVGKELRKRQDEQYLRDEQMAQQHLAMAQQKEQEEAAEVHGFSPEAAAMQAGAGIMPGEEGMPPPGPEGMPPEGMPPGPEGMPPPPPPGGEGMPPEQIMRGLSSISGEDYRNKLEEFRGRAYDRGGSVGDTGLFRSRTPGKREQRDLSEKKGFGVILKAEFGSEPKETLKERSREDKASFTTREAGVRNAPDYPSDLTSSIESEEEDK